MSNGQTIDAVLARIHNDMDRDIAAIKRILAKAEAEGRKNLTAEEDAECEDLHERIKGNEEAYKRAIAVKAEEDEAEKRLDILHDLRDESKLNYDTSVRIGNEPSVYREIPEMTWDGRPKENSYLQDLYRCQIMHDPGASERIARHGKQMESERPQVLRAVGTSAVSGFVPPQYLSNLFAEYARAGRPTANLVSHLPLPEAGMSVSVPRITTPTAVAVQQTEGGAIGNQDLDDTLDSSSVRTVAGYVDLSRQSIERGVLVESLTFGDLAAAYNVMLDAQVLNGSGSNGQHLGILNVTGVNSVVYTATTPAVSGLWPKLASAVGQVVSGRYAGPNALIMHPDMWSWLLSEINTTDNRPQIEPGTVAYNPLGTSNAPGYEGVVGQLFNVPVKLDGNMPTNLGTGTDESRIVVADFRDCILFEESSRAPAQLKFEDVLSSTLQVRLLAYGYSAFYGGRYPKAISVVSGTGCIIPSL